MTAPERAAHTPGEWYVNGQRNLGYRIDSFRDDGPVGLDFLMKPVAIVPKLEDAEHIIATANAAPAAAALLKEALAVLQSLCATRECLCGQRGCCVLCLGKALLARAKAVAP